jgi:hypothetical protein
MPIIPCVNRITCEGVDTPFSNFSSEAPDLFDFRAFAWVLWNPNFPLPPDLSGRDTGDLPIYWAEGCNTVCVSISSQAEADTCAQRQAYLCGRGNEGGDGVPPALFSNAAQTCTALCADGSPFSFTVPAGWFTTTSQSLSDQTARAYACALANAQMVCLSSLSQGCVNVPYSEFISVTRGTGAFTFSLIGGTIPPGMSLAQYDSTSAILSGTPTTAGNYTFRIRARSTSGAQTARTYTVAILAITNFASAPVPKKGTAYSFQLAGSGGTPPYVFSLVSGSLPDGLTLSSTGLISGTPTAAGTSNFVLGIHDATTGGANCTLVCTLVTQNNVTCPTQLNQFNLGANNTGMAPYCGLTSMIAHPNKVYVQVGAPFDEFRVFDADTQTQYTTFSLPNPGFTSIGSAAYAPGTDKLFVQIFDFFTGTDYLQIINTATDALGATISDGPLGDLHGYYALSYDSTLDRVIMLGDNNGATNAFSDALILNPHTNGFTRFICTVVPGAGNEVANDIAYCPLNNKLYVACETSGGVGTIRGYDATTHALLSSVGLGVDKPKGIVWNPDKSRFYIYTSGGATDLVYVYDPATDTVETTVAIPSVSGLSKRIAYWNNKTLIAAPSANKIYFVDPSNNTVLCSVAVTTGFDPIGVGGDRLFVSFGAFLTVYN